MTDEEKEQICVKYNDCRICPLAAHLDLLSTTKHICTAEMTEEQKHDLSEEGYYQ